jgi:hypothetical protein
MIYKILLQSSTSFTGTCLCPVHGHEPSLHDCYDHFTTFDANELFKFCSESGCKTPTRVSPLTICLSVRAVGVSRCNPAFLLIRNYRIARNIGHFETWSTHQCCEQVSYSDLPEEIKADVAQVFDVTGRLPAAWADKVCSAYGS